MEDTISIEKATDEKLEKSAPMVAHSESSPEKTQAAPKRTTRTRSAVSAAMLLEILGDTILKLEDGGIGVTLKEYDRDGVTGTAIFLRDVQVDDGVLVSHN